MARRIDEDAVLAVLLNDDSEEENLSESEPEDHLEADPAYETEGEDEVFTVNDEQLPDEDYEASDTSPPCSTDDATPSTSADRSDLIIRPSRTILRGKDKHKWSSQQSRSLSRTASRNIVHIRPGPVRSYKNLLEPLGCFSCFITDNMIDLIVTHTNAEIAIKSHKYKTLKSTQRPTDPNEIRAPIGILTLSAAMKDNHLLYLYD
ncbi:uncharacterized protein LOC132903185 [Amyelois transitella]|uniref:uncharacterized protein LOC132903185 n=1 Tax=Amyelois transitella TaxID=680683 RepID=UPI00298FEA4A|nr:uncharacterized protein LOC132903185 [Amyelois transitella]